MLDYGEKVKLTNSQSLKMTHSQIHNRKELESLRKDLRKHLTPAEATLWSLIKGKQLEGRKFRRQHSVDKYVLDFYCPSERLAIELDGEPHFSDEGIKRDEKRTEYLNSQKIFPPSHHPRRSPFNACALTASRLGSRRPLLIRGGEPFCSSNSIIINNSFDLSP